MEHYLPPAVKMDPQEAANSFNERAVTPATAVFDRGRRGNPLPGCDCVQCFGYCMIDGDLRDRVVRTQAEDALRVMAEES